MKRRKVVSAIGALVLIISAVVLITGCPQVNGNKDKKNNTSRLAKATIRKVIKP